VVFCALAQHFDLRVGVPNRITKIRKIFVMSKRPGEKAHGCIYYVLKVDIMTSLDGLK
jgi:hypothetical protein